MVRRTPHIVCRYAKDCERRVRERTEELHCEMMRYSGRDLVIYPDGLSMAADWQKELRHQLASKPQDEVQAALERHGIASGRPSMSVPDELLQRTDGIGVFLNPDEGKEIMSGFDLLVSGLPRKGNGLTEDEEGVIRGFIESEAISPRFVKRMVADYGDESIEAAHMLPPDTRGCALEYLLRRHKGHFFRTRYPALSIV